MNERSNGRYIDLLKVADDAKFNAFHVSILAWCALVIIFDGYDLAVSGIALPSIMKDMNVDATRAGMMVSSALFGAMCGAVLLGSLADRIGRRPLARQSATWPPVRLSQAWLDMRAQSLHAMKCAAAGISCSSAIRWC